MREISVPAQRTFRLRPDPGGGPRARHHESAGDPLRVPRRRPLAAPLQRRARRARGQHRGRAHRLRGRAQGPGGAHGRNPPRMGPGRPRRLDRRGHHRAGLPRPRPDSSNGSSTTPRPRSSWPRTTPRRRRRRRRHPRHLHADPLPRRRRTPDPRGRRRAVEAETLDAALATLRPRHPRLDHLHLRHHRTPQGLRDHPPQPPVGVPRTARPPDRVHGTAGQEDPDVPPPGPRARPRRDLHRLPGRRDRRVLGRHLHHPPALRRLPTPHDPRRPARVREGPRRDRRQGRRQGSPAEGHLRARRGDRHRGQPTAWWRRTERRPPPLPAAHRPAQGPRPGRLQGRPRRARRPVRVRHLRRRRPPRPHLALLPRPRRPHLRGPAHRARPPPPSTDPAASASAPSADPWPAPASGSPPTARWNWPES